MGRLFAAIYDRVMASAERRCLAGWRRELLEPVRGDVLEIGAGTGANLEHLPSGVGEVHMAEPSAPMRKRLERRIEACGSSRSVRALDAGAESIPLPEASVDAVLSTLVLCSVQDPQRALAEVRRVLRPGGSLRLIEHIAHDGHWTKGLQRGLDPLWRVCADGCRLTRSTGETLREAGFDTSALEQRELRPGAPWIRRVLVGAAAMC